MTNEFISYEQVRSGVQELNDCANKMQQIFEEVAGSVNMMTAEDTFAGQASNALSNEFQPFKAKFADYISAVRRFSALFTAAANALEANEQNISNQAGQL